MATITYAKITVKEPFPVFYSHVSQKFRRANDPRAEGPLYAAGSEFWHIADTPQQRAYHEGSAEHLRRDGYTVTTEFIEKPLRG